MPAVGARLLASLNDRSRACFAIPQSASSAFSASAPYVSVIVASLCCSHCPYNVVFCLLLLAAEADSGRHRASGHSGGGLRIGHDERGLHLFGHAVPSTFHDVPWFLALDGLLGLQGLRRVVCVICRLWLSLCSSKWCTRCLAAPSARLPFVRSCELTLASCCG